MRGFTLDSFDTQPSLRDDLSEPVAGDDEMLVRVHASSVNPVDVFIASGAMREMAEHLFPVTLGRDFAGVVEQVGSGIAGTASATRCSASFSMPTRPRTRAAGPS
jgi:NADPH2:quinone reductase